MCSICDRIKMIKDGINSFFVKELETGYVVIGDNQHFKGLLTEKIMNHEYPENLLTFVKNFVEL